MTPLRPAVVCHTNTAGGAERYLVSLYRGLHKRRHDATLVGSVPGWSEVALPRISVPLGPKWGGGSTPWVMARLPRERFAVARALDRLHPSVIHVQFKREQIGLAGVLVRRAPVVWTEHGRFPTGRYGRALAAAYREASRHVSTIICVSPAVADDVQHIVGKRSQLEVVPNAVDTVSLRPPTSDEKRKARQQLGLPESEPVLAWLGRLEAGKLPLLAVDVAGRFDGVTVLAGSGSYAGRVASLAGNRLRYLGFLTDPTVLYRAADVLLFTSNGAGEGFPTYTMLEAAAHGLPVVANIGSGLTAVEAPSGTILADDDPAALARAAEAALAERAMRSTAARRSAEQHDVRAWLDRHEEIFAAAEEGGSMAVVGSWTRRGNGEGAA